MPLAYIIIFLGIFAGILESLAKMSSIKKEQIAKIIEPKVKEIDNNKDLSEDEKINLLSILYKENHYSAIKPMLLKIFSFLVYILSLSSVIFDSTFDRGLYSGETSFLEINNIFDRQIMIFIPLAILILRLAEEYALRPLSGMSIKKEIVTVLIIVSVALILPNIMPPTYSLFILGTSIISCPFQIYFRINQRLKAKENHDSK